MDTNTLKKLQNGIASNAAPSTLIPLLNELKLAIIDFQTLPPCSQPAPPAQCAQQRELATATLEAGVILSVMDGDMDAFARCMNQLRPLQISDGGAVSESKCRVLGLNLFSLLVAGKLSEFHSELELLTPAELASPVVAFPVTLERWLMVGSYDQVLGAKNQMPDKIMDYFMGQLVVTVREDIAECSEVSYRSMPIEKAREMMMFDTKGELISYVEEFHEDWLVDGGNITFQVPDTGLSASDIPSQHLINRSLAYATELERIV